VVSVVGDVGQARPPPPGRVHRRHVGVRDPDLALRDREQTRDGVGELTLSVPGDARDADDLASPHDQVDPVEPRRLHAA
jgi:hypothetical protein